MRGLNKFILEKLHLNKNIKSSNPEDNDSELFILGQYENLGNKGGYSTFLTENIEEYKYCFSEYNKEVSIIVLHVFNDFKEYAETPGWDNDDINILSKVNVGQCIKIKNDSILARLW